MDETRQPSPEEPAPADPADDLGAESEALSSLLLALASAPEREISELAPRLEPGAVVGRFELLRELGRGGFGVVFAARDRELGRLVAFKALRRSSRARPDAIEKPLREEAEAAARLNHPNVVTLHDYGLHEGTPYLILELLEGETLHERLKRGALGPDEAIGIAADMARGLVHAHAQGVLHRDLKPANVILTAQGGTKILDFGLARLVDRAGLSGGTPAYMAPEQLRGGPGDARTDVFSAAVVLFQMLSGELPFPPRDGKSTVLEPGPSPRLPIADVPPELAALLASALSKDPTDRPQGAAQWLEGLEGVRRAYAQRALERSRAQRRRRLRRLVAGVGILSTVAAVMAAVAAGRSGALAERKLRASRIASAAEGASDPLVAALLMAELPDDPPPRTVEIANRVLRQPIPMAVLDVPRGGFGMAVAPDGSRVAVATQDGGAVIWRADGTGAALHLDGGGNRANGLAFTPDGRRLVATGHDGDVRVFPADGSAPPLVLRVADTPLLALRLDPTGRVAAAAGHDGRLWLVDVSGRRAPIAVPHGGPVLAMAWSPHGDRIATGSGDGWLGVYDAATGAARANVPVPGGALFDLAWSPDGAHLAAASEDGHARVLAPDGRVLERSGAGGYALGSIAFDPEGRRIVSASSDGSARVHVIGDPASDVRLRGHREAVLAARFVADGRRVFTVSQDGTARLWPSDGDGEPVVLAGGYAYEGAISPDGLRAFTRDYDGKLRVWRTDDPRDRGLFKLEGTQAVEIADYTRDGTRLFVGTRDGAARMLPVHGGEPGLIREPGRRPYSGALDPAERTAAIGYDDGVVRLYDAATGARKAELRGHEGPILSVAWSKDGARLASASADRTVRVWGLDGSPPRVLAGHQAAVTSVAWLPDGGAVVSSSGMDATVRIWPLAGGVPRVLEASAGVFEVAVTPGGTVLVPEQGGLLRLFWPDGRCDGDTFPALPEGLVAAQPSRDGSLVALTSRDGTIRVYPMSGEGTPLVLRGDAGKARVVFSPDKSELAMLTAGGAVRLLTIDWPKLRDQLRASTTACLPAEYRVQLLGEQPADADRNVAECHRLHGRALPERVVPTAAPAAASAAPVPERKG